MWLRGLAGALLFLWAAASALAAGEHEFTVTRDGRNFYRVDGRKLLIVTRLCLAKAQSSRAGLRVGSPTAGPAGELVFMDSKELCAVTGLFTPAEARPGSYAIAIDRIAEDWYQIGASGTFLRTSGCTVGARQKEVGLLLSPGGGGRVVFREGRSCPFDGLFTRLPP